MFRGRNKNSTLRPASAGYAPNQRWSRSVSKRRFSAACAASGSAMATRGSGVAYQSPTTSAAALDVSGDRRCDGHALELGDDAGFRERKPVGEQDLRDVADGEHSGGWV